MSSLPLRNDGPLVLPSRWPIQEKNDPPRALKSLAQIVDNGLCHRCGSCIGICPTGVLGLDKEEYPVVENLSACTDCDLCVKVCPGDSFEVPSIAKQLFGHIPDYGNMHGHFEAAYLSYAKDPKLREDSTSGGLVTGLLISLLERDLIDGAVVIKSDQEALWKGAPALARTKNELLSSTKSKYAISPTNIVFEEIRKTPGRYAIVGLPCQIHGFHKAARLDRRIRERVVLSIGLFCHAAVEHEPMNFIWENLGEHTKNAKRFISRVGKHPGTPHLIKEDGTSVPVYFPEAKGYRPSSMEIINILYRLYTPERCLTCYDSTSEFADIAVGDPWMPKPADDINFYEGYSFALARTEKAKKLLEETQTSGDIELVPLSKEQARKSNTMMGEEKRWRAFRIIETHKRQGKSIPNYDFETPRPSGKQLLLTEANIFSHIFCFFKHGRELILRLTFSPLGYALLWLNNKKRRFRTWRADFRAWLSRKRTP